MATHSSLVQLISFWHDPEGLCRAIDEVGPCIVLAIDRHNPDLHRKCQQRIDIDDGVVHIPCFSNSMGDITFLEYHVCAICYHLGEKANMGHYRTILRYRGLWMNYDDNQLPERQTHIPEYVLQNCTLIWVIHPSLAAVRTMREQPGMGIGPRADHCSTIEITSNPTISEDTMEPSTVLHTTVDSANTVSMEMSVGSATNETPNAVPSETHGEALASDLTSDAGSTQVIKRARHEEPSASTTARSIETLSCQFTATGSSEVSAPAP